MFANMIPADFIEVVRERVEKVNRRFVKKGLPTVSVITTGKTEDRRKCSVRCNDPRHDASCYVVKYIEVEVIGDIPKYSGWRLIGSVDDVDGRPFFRPVPGEDIPVKYRDADPKNCDHCGINRQRNMTHIVAHDDGRTMQAGSTCIKDFLGWDVSSVVSYWEDIGSLSEYDESYGGSYVKPVFKPMDIVTLACRVVSVDGFYMKSAMEQDSTKSKVFEFLFPPRDPSVKWYQEFTAKYNSNNPDANAAEATLFEATMAAWSDVTPSEVNKSDWLYNLSVCMSAENVGMRQVGVLCSIVILGLRRLEEAGKRDKYVKSDKRPSAFIGNVGGKVVRTVTVTDVRYISGEWGDSHLLTMVDDAGDYMKWFATNVYKNMPDDIKQAEDIKGRRFIVSGTVKKHEEYKGMKSTVLTRCLMEVK
jgi:hypothetical protein